MRRFYRVTWSRTSRQEIIARIHVVEEGRRAVNISVILYISKVNMMFPFITLDLDEKILENSYKVTLLNGKMTILIMSK